MLGKVDEKQQSLFRFGVVLIYFFFFLLFDLIFQFNSSILG
jgi:hypothetical protein